MANIRLALAEEETRGKSWKCCAFVCSDESKAANIQSRSVSSSVRNEDLILAV